MQTKKIMTELKISFGPQQRYTLYVPVPRDEHEKMLGELLKNVQTLIAEIPSPRRKHCKTQKVLPFYK